MVILIKREFNTCGVSEAFMFYHYEELVAQLLYETEYETPFWSIIFRNKGIALKADFVSPTTLLEGVETIKEVLRFFYVDVHFIYKEDINPISLPPQDKNVFGI